MFSIDEALVGLVSAVTPQGAEELPLNQLLGRVTAEDVATTIALPPFTQSAMDGYAVLAGDTQGATAQSPVRLKVAGEVAAGDASACLADAPGQAIRIFTGAALPGVFDAVVKQEDVERQGDAITLRAPVQVQQNVRQAGEELGRGSRIVATGVHLRPGHLAAMSHAGVAKALVRKRPRVAILTTGNEVVQPGNKLPLGCVFDANQTLLRSWFGERGITVAATHLQDSLEGTQRALDHALSEYDLVVTTGGVSVGDYDYIIPAAEALGVQKLFWKVSQKPGKPLYAATRAGKLLLGLPGNPAAVFACLVVYVSQALRAMNGLGLLTETNVGRLAQPVRSDAHRDLLLRCRLSFDSAGAVALTPLQNQASHMIAALGDCDVVARIGAGQGTLEAGTRVAWFEARSLMTL